MANQVVGGAAVEITIDLVKFATDTRNNLTRALSSPQMRDTITQALDHASANATEAGAAAASRFASGLSSDTGALSSAGTKAGEAAAEGLAAGAASGTASLSESGLKAGEALTAGVTAGADASASTLAEAGARGGAEFASAVTSSAAGAEAGLTSAINDAQVTATFDTVGADAGSAYSDALAGAIDAGSADIQNASDAQANSLDAGAANSLAQAGATAGDTFVDATKESLTKLSETAAPIAAAEAAKLGVRAGEKAAAAGGEVGRKFGEKMTESVKGLTSTLGPIVGVLGTGELIKSSLEAADQLEGANIKIENVFGESGKSVERWASGVATSLGQSQVAAETTAGKFGAYLSGLGVGKEEAAGLSEQLVTVGANIAAFNNADKDTVNQALSSALSGRSSALKQYGVTLTTAQINQEALNHASELGITVTNGTIPKLDAHQKALATLYAVMDATKNQQGAVAATSETLRAKQQVLTAEFANMRAQIGTALVPVLGVLVGFLANGLIPALSSMAGFIKQNWEVFAPLAIAVGSFAGVLGTLFVSMKTGKAIVEGFKDAHKALNLVMAANPIVLIVAALVALGVAFYYAYTHSKTFRDIVDAIGRAIKSFATDAINFFTHTIPAAFSWFISFIEEWGLLFLGPVGAIIKYWSQISEFFVGLWNDVEGVFTSAWTWVSNFFTAIPGEIMGWLKDAGNWLVGIGHDILDGLWVGIQWYWNSYILGFWGDLGKTIVGFFSGAGSWLLSIGSDIINGLWDGIKNAIGAAGGFVSGVAGDIVGAIKDAINSILHLPWRIPDIDLGFGISIGGQTLIPRLAAGGPIIGPGGPTSDSIHIMASPGEYMVNAPAYAANPGLVQAINAGRGKTIENGPATHITGRTDPALLAGIMALANRPVIVQVDNREIARAANNGNLSLGRGN